MPRRNQIINGVEYVYEYDSTWNSEKKYGDHKRNYIGKIVDGVFVPNKKHLLEIALEDVRRIAPSPVPVTFCNRAFYGATYLFDTIGEKLGITIDLQKCFPDTYQQILSIAYYLILEDRNPFSRFSKWSRTHMHPFRDDISSQRCSDLLGSISENAKQHFFRLQGKRRLEREFLAYDITSVSSYSKLIKQVRYGNNKEHDPLAQINLALLFGEESRLPVYYRKLPGNITDVMTIHKMLADIDFLELEKVNLIMDRGFYSEANINALYQKHYKFLIAAKTSLKFVQQKLEEVRNSMTSRSTYSSKYRLNYHSSTEIWHYKETKKRSGAIATAERKMYLHLFFNTQRAADDKTDFNDLLDSLEEELRSDKRIIAHEHLYEKYYEVKQTPKRGIVLSHKEDAIMQAEKNYGYFALISNGIKDPLKALQVYRSKDVVEKAFGNLKERLNMRRTSVFSEHNLEGKLFVQFVALIYLSYIDKVMRENSLYKRYTMQELLDELDIIERFEQPGRKHHVGEVTKRQLGLYKCFGVEVPA